MSLSTRVRVEGTLEIENWKHTPKLLLLLPPPTIIIIIIIKVF